MPIKTPAALYVERGKPMVIDEIELSDPGPTQVSVRHFATGVCHSQLHELNRPDTKLPMVLGHESTGIITAVGSDVTHVKEGDHVMVSWVPRHGMWETPPLPSPAVAKYKGTTLEFGRPEWTGVFTWSRDAVVDQQMVVPFDKEVDTEVTSIIGCAVMTGAGAALHAARVRPGDSVAIIGVGGVGLSIVQACANLSADPIIVIDVDDEKLEYARQFGATIGINAKETDPVAAVQSIMGGKEFSGVDFAFDAIGVGQTMDQVLQIARARKPGQTLDEDGGVALLVGVPHGDMPTLPMRMLFRSKVYRGAFGGCCIPERDFPLFVSWFKDGKLPLDRLVTRRYSLEQINEACQALASGEVLGRAIVEF